MAKIAIITARGGSKRIPRKNIKDFCGKPIIAYSIEAAIESHLFDEVMVSTDNQEIAEIAKKYGAKVPFMRSDKNADDHANTANVLLEVLHDYKKIGKFFEVMCCIYPTAPFVSSDKLISAYKKLEDKQADALIPIVKFSYPPQRSFVLKDERLTYKWPENIFKRSQDLESLYHDAGQFYLAKVAAFEKEKTLVPVSTSFFVLNEMEVQDIDNEEDWEIAEIKYQLRGAVSNGI